MTYDPFAVLGKTLSLDALSELTKLAGAEFGARMIPGRSFDWDPERKALTYPRNQVAKMDGLAGPGKIYHNLGHARFSRTENPLGLAVKNIVASLPQPKNKPLISESDVLGIIAAAEDERMEMHVRAGRPGLEHSYLPRHDDGYRGDEWAAERDAALAEFQADASGLSVDQGRSYWKNVATAIRGLVSGALDRHDLPERFQWSDELIEAITDLRNAPTADDLVRSYETIVPQLIKERLDPPQPPDESEEQNDNPAGDNDDPSDESGQNGDGSEEESAGKREPERAPLSPDRAREQLESAIENAAEDAIAQMQVEAEKGDDVDAGADFVNSDPANSGDEERGKGLGVDGDAEAGGGASTEAEEPDDEILTPTWREVCSTVEPLLGPLRKTAVQVFQPNEASIVLRRQRRGRLDVRSVLQSLATADDRIYRQRVVKGNDDYAAYLLIDRSYSMQGGLDEDVAFPEVFGTWEGTRSQLAARLMVALVQTFDRFPSIRVGVGAFDVKSSAHSIR
jgi:hypothetical protein